MKKQMSWMIFGVAMFLITASPAYASVESTLGLVQTRLITTILPLAAILGLVYAGLSFVAGSPSAKPRLVFAIMGAVIGFGAPSIMEFIRSLVH